VENVKAQLAQQENRLMNAELAETHLGSVWLQQNAAVEQMTKKLTAETDAINRQIREINKVRQGMQTRAFPELSKLLHKKQLSFQRKWQCQVAYAQLRDQLLGACC
jgi:predicted  nucleic acid-binding Zn-ribbon protein